MDGPPSTQPEPRSSTEGGPSLAEVLAARRDQIVASFVAEVKRLVPAGSGLSEPLLVDQIPTFLDQLVSALERRRPGDSASPVSAGPALEHGEQRWRAGYDLEALLREYGILRQCILTAAKEHAARFELEELEALGTCIDVGMARAARVYSAYRDQEQREAYAKVEFLAEVGQVLSSTLDYRSTLSRVTATLVPRLADWCVVHVGDDAEHELPIVHVDPAKTQIVRQIFERYPLPSDSPYGYPYVQRTGQAQLVSEIDSQLLESAARDAEHLRLLRLLGACSWIVVPMQVQGHILGALTLVYGDSGRRYGPSDLLLAGEIARRAAVAIDNARLYELSQQARSKLEAATRAKDEFVAMVSHELRTPLNAILGWVRLLRSGNLEPDRASHAHEVIERNAEAQHRLVADLLDISRTITGKLRITPSQLDLSSLIELVIEGLRPAADAKRLRIDASLDREHAVLRADGDRLQQVLWNLIGNAIKFTPKGGVVRVELRRVDSDLELSVMDTGVGIPSAFLPHVFESFRQLDSSTTRVHGGLGIGLSIAKQIVELHGGSIGAESAGEGLGAKFVVRLPISPLLSTTLGVARVPATKERDSSASLPSGLGGVRVLVVDDEADARELVAYVLETCGAEACVAGSAAEALAMLERQAPHVVISDIGMPVEDGYSLIRSIRTLPDEERRSTPAIALTAFTRNQDRTRALVEGFNLHLPKPVEPAVLVSAVVELAALVRR